MNLYLDDERTPKIKPNDWIVVRSFAEAINYCEKNGCPSYISFDHDLGEAVPTGYDFAKWLTELDMDMNGKFIPANFQFNVHSANRPGRLNIEGLLDNYLQVRVQSVELLESEAKDNTN